MQVMLNGAKSAICQNDRQIFEFNEDLNHKLMNFHVNYEFLRI